MKWKFNLSTMSNGEQLSSTNRRPCFSSVKEWKEPRWKDKQNTSTKELIKREVLTVERPEEPLTGGVEAAVVQTSALHERVALGALAGAAEEAVVGLDLRQDWDGNTTSTNQQQSSRLYCTDVFLLQVPVVFAQKYLNSLQNFDWLHLWLCCSFKSVVLEI